MHYVCASVLKPELSYPEIRPLHIKISWKRKPVQISLNRKDKVSRAKSSDCGSIITHLTNGDNMELTQYKQQMNVKITFLK